MSNRKMFAIIMATLLFAAFGINILSLNINNAHFSFQTIGQLHIANPLIWFAYLVMAGVGWTSYRLHQCLVQQQALMGEKKHLEKNQQSALSFASELTNGNLEASYSQENSNELGRELVRLRDQLKENQQKERKRQEEEQQRNWISEGLSRFNDILRKDKQNDLNELSYEIISNLVRYIDANQGGLFILQENDESSEQGSTASYFELAAAFAFNRKKYLTKKIEWGEGLVGTCAIEQHSIYMTEIPEDYIYITSGLGDANPRSLLIVPLISDEKVEGVLEIASFHPLEKYQRDLVERIAGNIASTISSIKINKRTNELLTKSQQQAEELASQEEELRQNMEEMKATQESLEESQAKTRMIFDNAMDAIITIDESGVIDQFSPSAEKLFGYKAEEVQGKNVKILMPQSYATEHDQYIRQYKDTGERKILGKTRHEQGITKQGHIFPLELRVEEAWLNNSRMFVGMLRDITERKQAEEEMQQQMEEIRSKDEELRQNIEELRATQESLEEKDKKQKEEIDKLNRENQERIERIEQLKAEQARKDQETKKLYEGEIDQMFRTWMNQLENAEKKLNNS